MSHFEIMEERVQRVVRAGFDYQRFSDQHVRFEWHADYWASTERWRVASEDIAGRGTDDLIRHLRLRFPELATPLQGQEAKQAKRWRHRQRKKQLRQEKQQTDSN